MTVKRFPLAGMPRSYSAALAPRPTERYLARVERVARGDREALRALLDRFPDDIAASKYERLWLALAEGSDAAEVERLAREAAKANPHVLPYFLGQAEPPMDLPDYIALGGEEEAASYAMMAARWWFGEPRAVAWLKTQLERE